MNRVGGAKKGVLAPLLFLFYQYRKGVYGVASCGWQCRWVCGDRGTGLAELARRGEQVTTLEGQLKERLECQSVLVKASLEIGEVNEGLVTRNQELIARCKRLAANNEALRNKIHQQRESSATRVIWTGFSMN